MKPIKLKTKLQLTKGKKWKARERPVIFVVRNERGRIEQAFEDERIAKLLVKNAGGVGGWWTIERYTKE